MTEGLLPTLTLALAMGSQRMAKRNALFRHLPAVESLGAATVICTDKTGTLTQNRLTVASVWLGGRRLTPDDLPRQSASAGSQSLFWDVAKHAHSLQPGTPGAASRWLGDPIEVALAELADRVAPRGDSYSRLDEIPFDSARRRMCSLHAGPAG